MTTAPENTGDTGIVEVKLRDVGQLFNSLDPTPFPEKDLDADAEEFIVSWAKEHHKHLPLKLRIHIANPATDQQMMDSVEPALHAYFAYRADMMRFKLRQLLSRGRWSLLIGLLFLAVCLGAADFVDSFKGTSAIIQIFRESLIIGGWVAMWRPMEIFLYDWWPLRYERRIFTRLSQAPVEIIVGK